MVLCKTTKNDGMHQHSIKQMYFFWANGWACTYQFFLDYTADQDHHPLLDTLITFPLVYSSDKMVEFLLLQSIHQSQILRTYQTIQHEWTESIHTIIIKLIHILSGIYTIGQ